MGMKGNFSHFADHHQRSYGPHLVKCWYRWVANNAQSSIFFLYILTSSYLYALSQRSKISQHSSTLCAVERDKKTHYEFKNWEFHGRVKIVTKGTPERITDFSDCFYIKGLNKKTKVFYKLKQMYRQCQSYLVTNWSHHFHFEGLHKKLFCTRTATEIEGRKWMGQRKYGLTVLKECKVLCRSNIYMRHQNAKDFPIAHHWLWYMGCGCHTYRRTNLNWIVLYGMKLFVPTGN